MVGCETVGCETVGCEVVGCEMVRSKVEGCEVVGCQVVHLRHESTEVAVQPVLEARVQTPHIVQCVEEGRHVEDLLETKEFQISCMFVLSTPILTHALIVLGLTSK